MLSMLERDYVSVEEAASRAGVSSQSIRRAIRGGFLRYRGERGRQKLLDANELDEGLRRWREQRREIRPLDDH